jgi:hypothetical protein
MSVLNGRCTFITASPTSCEFSMPFNELNEKAPSTTALKRDYINIRDLLPFSLHVENKQREL